MSEFFESLIISIGGGAVALIGGLTIFKSLLIKLFETGLESSFEKNIEKLLTRCDRNSFIICKNNHTWFCTIRFFYILNLAIINRNIR